MSFVQKTEVKQDCLISWSWIDGNLGMVQVGIYKQSCSCVFIRRFFGRLFPYVTHTRGIVVNYSLRDLRKDTLKSKRFEDQILCVSPLGSFWC